MTITQVPDACPGSFDARAIDFRPAPPRTRLVRARAAIFAVFGVNGFLLAMWVVHIPAIEHRTGIRHSTLGTLLLLLAAGAIAGMQLTGPLADRFGSRRLTILAGGLLAAATAGPGLATSAWQLGLALLIFGFANGGLDVSMNSQAVRVEQLYRRPIMTPAGCSPWAPSPSYSCSRRGLPTTGTHYR